jgi:hypothetical protein
MRNISILILLACSVGSKSFAQEKKITEDISANGINVIEVDNKKSMTLEFVPWNGADLKISYTYNTSQAPSGTTDTKLNGLGFEITHGNGKVTVICNPVNDKSISTAANDHIVIDGKTYYRDNAKRADEAATDNKQKPANSGTAIFYIPKGRELIISNAGSANVVIPNAMEQADVEMNGGDLRVDSMKKLNLKSVFASISLKAINRAAININGGQLYIEKIGSLAISSSYTQPRIGTADSIHLVSSLADNYTVEHLGTLTGTKTFGSFIIMTLEKSIVLEKGKANSVQIKTIMPGASLIKVSSSNESLVLPVSNLKNYAIKINAPNNSELTLTDAIRQGMLISEKTRMLPVRFGDDGSVTLNSKTGNVNGQHTVFDIECFSCKIIFK